jgi:hypothetical protein
MVQYPRPYGFTRSYASHSEDLTVSSLTQTCINPGYTSTPRGVYNPCCCKKHKRLLNHIAISSCQVLSHGWVNQSPNDSIAVALWLRVGFANHCATIAGKSKYSHNDIHHRSAQKECCAVNNLSGICFFLVILSRFSTILVNERWKYGLNIFWVYSLAPFL